MSIPADIISAQTFKASMIDLGLKVVIFPDEYTDITPSFATIPRTAIAGLTDDPLIYLVTDEKFPDQPTRRDVVVLGKDQFHRNRQQLYLCGSTTSKAQFLIWYNVGRQEAYIRTAPVWESRTHAGCVNVRKFGVLRALPCIRELLSVGMARIPDYTFSDDKIGIGSVLLDLAGDRVAKVWMSTVNPTRDPIGMRTIRHVTIPHLSAYETKFLLRLAGEDGEVIYLENTGKPDCAFEAYLLEGPERPHLPREQFMIWMAKVDGRIFIRNIPVVHSMFNDKYICVRDFSFALGIEAIRKIISGQLTASHLIQLNDKQMPKTPTIIAGPANVSTAGYRATRRNFP